MKRGIEMSWAYDYKGRLALRIEKKRGKLTLAEIQDLLKINLPITLSAALGVKPRKMLELVERMVESGDAEYLIIKGRPVGRHPFCLASSSETWGDMYAHGELAKANLTITLEEYT